MNNRTDRQQLRRQLIRLATVVITVSLVASCGGGKKNLRQHKYTKKYKKRYGIKTFASDAIPKPEPLSKWGNPPSYTVFGKTYYVRTSSKNYVERGIASWYGKKFHGRRTSSGEPYDMYAMTAAHKTLPLPTYARVTNLENGRTIVVRINDRGPFVDNRLIDLTYSGAKRLGMLAKGTALVEVRAIDPLQKPFTAPRSYLVKKSPSVDKKPVPLQQFATRSRTSSLPRTLKPGALKSATSAPLVAVAPKKHTSKPAHRHDTAGTRRPDAQMLAESAADLPKTGFTATRIDPRPTTTGNSQHRQTSARTGPDVTNRSGYKTPGYKTPRYKGNFRQIPSPVKAPARSRTPVYVASRPAARYSPPVHRYTTSRHKPVNSPRYTTGSRYNNYSRRRTQTHKKRYRLYLQLGAFYSFENAHRLYNRLAALRVGTLNIHRARRHNRTLYRVRIGPLANVALLDRISMQLSRKGIRGSKVVID